MIQMGDLRLHLINDATVLSDPGGPFGLVPRALWSRYIEPDENYQVPMTTMCLLVQTSTDNIVVDTGYGTKIPEKRKSHMQMTHPQGRLLDALARQGLTADDITLVIDTHLHSDHCSGNTRFDEAGNIVATFPNAEYVVQRREYEDASQPNERTAATYLSENWEVLLANDQFTLLDGDTEIRPGITGVVAPGHTPGHMAVRFEGGGRHAAYVCDMASFAVHFERLAWMTAYDVEPLVTLETKRHWQQWALAHDALLIFPHEPIRPICKPTQDERGRLQLVPVDEPYA